MTEFGDYSAADRMKRIIEKTVKSVVREIRPDPRIGKVFSYSPGTQTALILFAGETVDSLVRVRVPQNLRPTMVMQTTFDTEGYDAPSDLVRVWGKPGGYFILGYHSGSPSTTREGVVVTNFSFVTATTKWVMTHNLGQLLVNVQAYNTNDDEIVGDVSYISENQVEIDWYYPQAGTAIVQT